tara:strand:+ start:10202 stop:11110 length:909 start_codon:yes stop_codon:yes gene_type:complete
VRITALIESPFQLFQLAEYINIYKIDSYKIILRLNSNKINNIQLFNTLKAVRLNRAKCFVSSNRFILLFNLLLCYRISGRVVIGDDNSGIYRIAKFFIPFRKITFLDDGTASLVSSSKGERFTIFEEVIGTKNKLSIITSLIEDNKRSDDPKRVIVLGGKLSEVGICTQETYFKVIEMMISDIRKKFSIDVIISYIPHRGECAYKRIFTEKFCKKYNVEIIQNELPVEFIAIERGIDILGVFGIFSTALFTMKLIYEYIDIEYYVISEKDLLLRKKGIIDLYQILMDTNMVPNFVPPISQVN